MLVTNESRIFWEQLRFCLYMLWRVARRLTVFTQKDILEICGKDMKKLSYMM
jgi:hypothetical protein